MTSYAMCYIKVHREIRHDIGTTASLKQGEVFNMPSYIIRSALADDCKESLVMAEKAIERHNNWHVDGDPIKCPNAPSQLIYDAIDESQFFEYVTETHDGVDDGWVDDDRYLDWVLERVTLYMLRKLGEDA